MNLKKVILEEIYKALREEMEGEDAEEMAASYKDENGRELTRKEIEDLYGGDVTGAKTTQDTKKKPAAPQKKPVPPKK